MLNLLKRLMPAAQLPPHLHYHTDEAGNRVLCDESVCRPKTRPSVPLYFPFN